MKGFLALVGCGPRLEVGLWASSLPAPALIALSGPTPRSDLIMTAVDLLLRAADMQPGDLSAVAATRGPGSFTGLRVALATAQGLAMGLGIPAQGYPSLDVQASRVAGSKCLAIQPARKGFAYAQPFTRSESGMIARDRAQIVPIPSLSNSDLPVIAPAGMPLLPETPLAATAMTTAEALLAILSRESDFDATTLAPLYLEAPPAIPPTNAVKAWRPSQKTS